ncbi:GNAT family N-acetyltransferase [Candidatus Poribacteria bacterium]|nr:GNAT family N-acetyltransferase [Candidatus Poribacteria bacterium]
MINPFIVGDRIYLRPLNVDDTDRYVSWLSDAEIRSYLGNAFPCNNLREKEYLEGLYKNDKDVILGIILNRDDKHIGGVGLHDISLPNSRAELGIMIGEKDCWSKGYGVEAIRLMLEYGFAQLNLNRIYLRVMSYNKRAIRCYEKTGFKHEIVMQQHIYKDGQYFDDYVMGILKEEWLEMKAKES